MSPLRQTNPNLPKHAARNKAKCASGASPIEPKGLSINVGRNEPRYRDGADPRGGLGAHRSFVRV